MNKPKFKPGLYIKNKGRTFRIMGVCHYMPTGEVCYAMMDESRNMIYVASVTSVEEQYKVI